MKTPKPVVAASKEVGTPEASNEPAQQPDVVAQEPPPIDKPVSPLNAQVTGMNVERGDGGSV